MDSVLINNELTFIVDRDSKIQTISHILTDNIPYVVKDEKIQCCISDNLLTDFDKVQVHVSTNERIVESLDRLNSSFNERLSDLSCSLTDTLNSIPTDKIIFSVIMVVVGAFTAWLFNYFNWTISQKNKEKLQTIDRIISIIDDLERVSVKYWLEDFIISNIIEQQYNEIKIKSLLKLVANQVHLLGEIEKNNYIIDNNYVKTIALKSVNEYCDKLFDTITGDNFEYKSRKKSKHKAAKISSICINARMKLHEYPYIRK